MSNYRRAWPAKTQTVYRVVGVREDGMPHSMVYGPWFNRAAARAICTRRNNEFPHATFTVEEASDWKEVP